MDFEMTQDQRDFVDAIHKACRPYGDDYWTKHDRDHVFPQDFFESMVEVGVVGMLASPEHGGGGATIEDAALALKAIAESGAGVNGCSTVHLSMFGFHPVVVHGSEELKSKYLPRVTSGEIHVSFSVTEPDAGSDTGRITTRAIPTDDGWRLRGRKVWMTKALQSSAALVLARTSPADEVKRPIDGLSLFVVDLDPDYVDIKVIDKMGRNAVASCEVVFDDLPIPRENLVGDLGRGFYAILDGLNPERILVASEAIGVGAAALARASQYATERVVFGRPIGQNQGIQHPLADAYMQLLGASAVVQKAARLYDSGQPCAAEANTAKFLAGRAGFFACDRAIQTHGGFGYATEYQVERLFRESRLMRIAPVSEEQIMNYMAEHQLKLPRSY
ncbi:acyl-CoA dehydrogenase family protein [Gordonia terrae]